MSGQYHGDAASPGKGASNPGPDGTGSPSDGLGHDTAGNGSHHGLLCRAAAGRKRCFGHTPHILRCQTRIQRNDYLYQELGELWGKAVNHNPELMPQVTMGGVHTHTHTHIQGLIKDTRLESYHSTKV